jgi:hypothetical protein
LRSFSYLTSIVSVNSTSSGSRAGRQDHQRARPVARLGDRRRLAQVHGADLLHGVDDGPGQPVGDLGHLEPDDLQLLGGLREVDEQVQAAPLEPVRELAGVVRGQHDERAVPGPDRPRLGHGHLEVRQHLEEERLELGLGLVDLVHEQHDRPSVDTKRPS